MFLPKRPAKDIALAKGATFRQEEERRRLYFRTVGATAGGAINRPQSRRSTSSPLRLSQGHEAAGQAPSRRRLSASPCKDGARRLAGSRQRSSDRPCSWAARVAGPVCKWPSSQSNACRKASSAGVREAPAGFMPIDSPPALVARI